MKAKLKTAILFSLLAASTSQGALLLTETFDGLTVGDLNGQNLWTADAALDVVAGGLSYTNGTISIAGGSNRATWSNVAADALGSKAFANQSADVWFSLTVNIVSTTTENRFEFYVSDDADNNNAGKIGQVRTNNGTLQGGYRVNSQTPDGGNVTVPYNETIFLVGRFSKDGSASTTNYDQMEFWLNPDSITLESTPSATYTVAASTIYHSAIAAVDTFGISTFIASGTGSEVGFDSVRVGTTKADVLDIYAVPEPSATMLLCFGVLGLACRRSRKG